MQSKTNDRDSSRERPPSIALPKGGGALRSIDEKFTVNAANGTCELSVPLPFSKTRSGLDGSVNLRYDSGSGNSVFGIGWSATLPSIQRRTDKQLPRYEDADESDVFVFAGSEDLVPALVDTGGGHWTPDVVTLGGVRAVRYRPRVEGGFARIEKITATGETFWKVTTRDNIATIFGRTAAARVADPGDPSRVFRWLPEWSYDDKGNCVEWSYKAEDLANVPDAVEERNRRSGLAPFANRHLKRIRYGNKAPYFADPTKPFTPDAPSDPHYLFDAIFDYGEHDDAAPSFAEPHTWPCRFDPFSEHRAGFEIRTYRLCRRVLFFHTFPELGTDPELVRSVDLDYRFFHFDGAPRVRTEAELLTAVRRTHYRRTGPAAYAKKSLPAVDLTYQELQWSHAVEEIAAEDVVNAPSGASSGYQWIDLYGDGAPGILTEQADAWYYKQNEGDGHFARAARVAPKPSLAGVAAGSLQFEDLDADGSKQAVARAGGIRGWFELDDDNEWLPFRQFDGNPSVDLSDPNTRLLDLDGDGRADLLISEEFVFRWFPSLGRGGFDAPRVADKPFDEERGPAVVFSDASQTVFIADMSGDGLGDIVRVRNGEVVYWPNLGHGRFGAKVTMADAPLLDLPDRFDPRLVQLADISGTGAADLIYLGRGDFRAWINLAGNGWNDEQRIDPFPRTAPPSRVAVIDILGNGTVSLVWSSELPADAGAPLRYVDLMGGRKPYILSGYKNNLGLEVSLTYRSSSHFALLDKRDGHPWATKLPFPTMCVSRTETRDTVAGTLLVREARYRHGYYDHAEREFRGFGMVEATDAETFEHFRPGAGHHLLDDSLHQPPRRTRTWYHTGAFVRGDTILGLFANDYFVNAVHPEHALPDARIETPGAVPPTNEERRQAARACKGMVLREETYADDGSLLAGNPYTTAGHNC
ncbi:MAG TPA: SpvB/TcaC N-terminal domain-containing protein, partial [Thermoanaerobaculia bacterium]|nr:SpvB/TcaC N-terminal domain-containing protein [Thermoanaerobaculia bacterium]